LQFRKSDPAAVAAAKAGFSPTTAYRLSPGDGSRASLPKEGAARPLTARSARRRVGQRSRPHAESGARIAADRRVRRASPPASGALLQNAPHTGAAHSQLARRPWFRAGGDISPGASAGPHGALGFLGSASLSVQQMGNGDENILQLLAIQTVSVAKVRTLRRATASDTFSLSLK
jgi:hypothetical protein